MGYPVMICLLVLVLFCLLKAEYPAVYPGKDERKVAFACQNSYIHLSCKGPREKIRILLANYGRFSLVVCNQDGVNKGWDVKCAASSSMDVVRQQCEKRRNCTFRASFDLFGDPCPETKKYIEVRYYCEKAKKITDKTDPPYAEIKPSESTQPTTVVTNITTSAEDKTNKGGHTEKQKNEKYCEAAKTSGLLFPKTSAGALQVTDCPAEMTGSASWQCGRRGKWVGYPNLNDCVSVWMDAVQSMIDLEASEVTLSRLNSKMRGKSLGPGDLRMASTKVIPSLVSKMKKEMKRNITKELKKEKIHSFCNEIVKSGSGLLNITQQESWWALGPDERKKSATSLIVSLEQMALEVASTIDEPATIASTEQNIVMEVSVIKMSRSHMDLKLPIMQYEQGPAAAGYHDFNLPLDGVAGISSTEDVAVTYLFYNNLEALMNPQNDNSYIQSRNSTRVINSNVISASIMKHSAMASSTHGRTTLKRPMNFKLSHKNVLRDKVAVCAYWKYNDSSLIGQWSQDGCRVVETNNDYTTCQCDHLTNFAILMDVKGTKLNKWHQMSLQAITYVGCSVSIICLLMCFISFTMFRNLQSDRNTIHKNLVFCLMVAELLFLFGIGQTQDQVLCSVIAGFLHFFFLTSFSWMCLEGIQLYFMLIEVFEAERSRVRWFYAFGYGVPAMIVGISAAIDHSGYGTQNHCWLKTDNYFILSFVIPAAIVILINIAMLSIAIYMMCRHAGVTASSIQARKKGKLEKMGTWLKGSAVLVVLLGLTWTFGFLYINEDMVAIAYIFTILNSLQGLFIFIFHCFMDRKVKKEWRRFIYKAKWLPLCCRVNLGGYKGYMSSPPTSSSGPQNYFLRFWTSRRRKRSSTSSATGRHRRSLDSFLRSDISSGTTTGTGVNRYSNQSDKLLPNGQNVYTALPTHYEGGVIGDLSVIDASVIDSEYMTEYCQHNMDVSKEKRRYLMGSDDSNNEDQKDNISHDSISNILSTDSNLKLNSEFDSDNEEGKVSYAVLENGGSKTFLGTVDGCKTESERNALNDLLSLYMNSKDKEEISVTEERLSQEILNSEDKCADNDKSITKRAPDMKYPTHLYNKQSMNSSTHPLLGSLPDFSTIKEEEGDSDPCSKSANFGTKRE